MADDTTSLSIHGTDVLQPWGLIDVDFKKEVRGLNIPPDWQIWQNVTPKERLDSFSEWYKTTLQRINTILWPRYDREDQVWRGASSKTMLELTEADLQLMLEIQHPSHGGRQFDKIPVSPLRSSEAKLHSDFFEREDEDGGAHMFDNFGFYDRTADETILADVPPLAWQSVDPKEAVVTFLFKGQLQRPRPMHTALRLRLADFEYKDAGTSVSPSMSSGHCLQALLCIGSVLERFLDDGVDLPDKRVRAFAQWAVDIGDRRVLAGVHYPSDNICSWILFLGMASFVFHRTEVKDILAKAILEQSYVHRQLHAASKFTKCFDAALREVKRLTEDPA